MRFPEWVVPMAATLTERRFTGPEWIFERKYDGIRLLAFRKGKTVQLLSRNQLPQNYPGIAAVIGALPVDQVILDGEVDWGDRNVEYHVFDILWLNGRDLMPRIRAHWVRPEIVVQVAFIEWTVHGKLRHGRFLGMREDKTGREVVRETR
jgi:ATP-dependent DNA ligase